MTDYTPEQAQAELMELTIKAARRCAYDLAHAVDYMDAGELRDTLTRRAQHWKQVFNPADGPKDYRHKLHMDNASLERRVAGLLALCKANEIDASLFDDPIPF